MKTTFVLALTLAAASVAVAQPVNGNLENTFRALKQEKTKVYLSLARLSSYHPMLMSYESHATEWTTIRDGLNRSGAMLRVLEQQRNAMNPAQAARFDGMRAQFAEVAAETQKMITQLREDQKYIARPAYLTAVKQLTAKASGARTQAIEILALSSGQGGSQTGD
jgi:hypothetical protein